MLKNFISIISFFLISVLTIGQEQFSSGIVYGPKAAYKIDAPKNWVLDNNSGKSIGLPCVLYLKGYTWENSPVIMYAKIAGTTFEKVDSFISFAIKEFVRRSQL